MISNRYTLLNTNRFALDKQITLQKEEIKEEPQPEQKESSKGSSQQEESQQPVRKIEPDYDILLAQRGININYSINSKLPIKNIEVEKIVVFEKSDLTQLDKNELNETKNQAQAEAKARAEAEAKAKAEAEAKAKAEAEAKAKAEAEAKAKAEAEAKAKAEAEAKAKAEAEAKAKAEAEAKAKAEAEAKAKAEAEAKAKAEAEAKAKAEAEAKAKAEAEAKAKAEAEAKAKAEAEAKAKAEAEAKAKAEAEAEAKAKAEAEARRKIDKDFTIVPITVDTTPQTSPSSSDYKVSNTIIRNSSIASDYNNKTVRTTTKSIKNSALSKIENTAESDLNKIADAIKTQLKQSLGSNYNAQLVENSINQAIEKTIATFEQNQSSTRLSSKKPADNDQSFLFTKSGLFSSIGKYSYNIKSLADTFISNFNNIIENNFHNINDEKKNVFKENYTHYITPEILDGNFDEVFEYAVSHAQSEEEIAEILNSELVNVTKSSPQELVNDIDKKIQNSYEIYKERFKNTVEDESKLNEMFLFSKEAVLSELTNSTTANLSEVTESFRYGFLEKINEYLWNNTDGEIIDGTALLESSASETYSASTRSAVAATSGNGVTISLGKFKIDKQGNISVKPKDYPIMGEIKFIGPDNKPQTIELAISPDAFPAFFTREVQTNITGKTEYNVEIQSYNAPKYQLEQFVKNITTVINQLPPQVFSDMTKNISQINVYPKSENALGSYNVSNKSISLFNPSNGEKDDCHSSVIKETVQSLTQTIIHELGHANEFAQKIIKDEDGKTRIETEMKDFIDLFNQIKELMPSDVIFYNDKGSYNAQNAYPLINYHEFFAELYAYKNTNGYSLHKELYDYLSKLDVNSELGKLFEKAKTEQESLLKAKRESVQDENIKDNQEHFLEDLIDYDSHTPPDEQEPEDIEDHSGNDYDDIDIDTPTPNVPAVPEHETPTPETNPTPVENHPAPEPDNINPQGTSDKETADSPQPEYNGSNNDGQSTNEFGDGAVKGDDGSVFIPNNDNSQYLDVNVEMGNAQNNRDPLSPEELDKKWEELQEQYGDKYDITMNEYGEALLTPKGDGDTENDSSSIDQSSQDNNSNTDSSYSYDSSDSDINIDDYTNDDGSIDTDSLIDDAVDAGWDHWEYNDDDSISDIWDDILDADSSGGWDSFWDDMYS